MGERSTQSLSERGGGLGRGPVSPAGRDPGLICMFGGGAKGEWYLSLSGVAERENGEFQERPCWVW